MQVFWNVTLSRMLNSHLRITHQKTWNITQFFATTIRVDLTTPSAQQESQSLGKLMSVQKNLPQPVTIIHRPTIRNYGQQRFCFSDCSLPEMSSSVAQALLSISFQKRKNTQSKDNYSTLQNSTWHNKVSSHPELAEPHIQHSWTLKFSILLRCSNTSQNILLALATL